MGLYIHWSSLVIGGTEIIYMFIIPNFFIRKSADSSSTNGLYSIIFLGKSFRKHNYVILIRSQTWNLQVSNDNYSQLFIFFVLLCIIG